MKRLERSFFERDPLVCARELIGCTLGLGSTSGIIVETEAYAAVGDPACHTWRRPSAREFVASNTPGAAYVYLNYGMHWLFNFLVRGGVRDGFVLIRALEPVEGIPVMKRRRGQTGFTALCNGPAKLTQALGITGSRHGADPFSEREWTLLHARESAETIASRRIGITLAADYPWRFTMKGNPCLSAKG